jgi:O-antigen/teichoic acid export membrane protein
MSRPFAADGRPAVLFEQAIGQLRRPFVRDAGVLQAGQFAAMGIGFLLSVALARILGAEGYGGYALVVSTLTTITLLKRLGHDYVATTKLAAAYATNDAEAARSTLVGFNVITLWSTLLIIPPAIVLAPAITDLLFKNKALGEPLRLALLPALWVMLFATLVIVLQCSRRLIALTLFENTNRLLVAASGLLFILAGTGLDGFFWGQAIASLLFAAATVLVYRQLRSHDSLLPSLADLMRDVLRPRLSAWPQFRSGLAVALDKNAVSIYPLAPILLLGSQAATDQVALLRVAMSYLAVPVLALSGVSRLLMVKFPQLRATQPTRARRFFLQVTGAGGLLSCSMTLPFVLLAPWVMELVYGRDFAGAARLVPFLAIHPLVAGLGIAAGPIFRAYGRNTSAIYAHVAVLSLGLPLTYFMVDRHGLAGAAISYAAMVTALELIAYGLCLRIVSQGENRADAPANPV